VLKEIRNDVINPQQMNRLLQGDVGSGKTLVALLSMLMAVDNGFQSCLMAPTEILARQHFETISTYLQKLDINVDILTGSTKIKDRRILHENLENGKIDLLIGTHALLEDKVVFQNLALVVIDEQHRFGVAQRAKLWKKNKFPPHILVMTATPIPRTLSMTLYGDLDVSIIDELPPGRKEVKTMWKTDSSRLQIINFMREQIKLERQIYIVFPLIEESEKLDYKNLMEGFTAIEREFPLPEFQVSVVHGQMKPEDKQYEMKRFVDGVTNIMVATTVIEVGVNVPNASVMIIESAERFGLSQLHQLRGRVGRGSEQSYCVLVSGNKVSVEGKTRLQTMVDTNDGFQISEVDLKLRGPGDMMGTKQSGVLDFKIADIIIDNKILHFARNEADLLLQDDAELEKAENINIARTYRPYARERLGWSRIS
jgi:ATP-dependent DNA helicase RecG